MEIIEIDSETEVLSLSSDTEEHQSTKEEKVYKDDGVAPSDPENYWVSRQETTDDQNKPQDNSDVAKSIQQQSDTSSDQVKDVNNNGKTAHDQKEPHLGPDVLDPAHQHQGSGIDLTLDAADDQDGFHDFFDATQLNTQSLGSDTLWPVEGDLQMRFGLPPPNPETTFRQGLDSVTKEAIAIKTLNLKSASQIKFAQAEIDAHLALRDSKGIVPLYAVCDALGRSLGKEPKLSTLAFQIIYIITPMGTPFDEIDWAEELQRPGTSAERFVSDIFVAFDEIHKNGWALANLKAHGISLLGDPGEQRAVITDLSGITRTTKVPVPTKLPNPEERTSLAPECNFTYVKTMHLAEVDLHKKVVWDAGNILAHCFFPKAFHGAANTSTKGDFKPLEAVNIYGDLPKIIKRLKNGGRDPNRLKGGRAAKSIRHPLGTTLAELLVANPDQRATVDKIVRELTIQDSDEEAECYPDTRGWKP